MTKHEDTPTLFEIAAEGEPFTVADLDEWIADVERSQWDGTHIPNTWAREGLSALLGEPVPFQMWTTKELLSLLRRARGRAS